MCAGVNGRGQAARGVGCGIDARAAPALRLTCCREAVERYSFKLMRTPDTEIKAKFTLPFLTENINGSVHIKL